MAQSDATGHNNYSRALANMVRGLNRNDAWNAHTAKTTYTHYTPKGASRLDRMYIGNNMKSKKIGIETVAAAFNYHFAVVLRIAIDAPIVSRGKGYWRMNTSLSKDATFKHVIQTHWKKWQTRKKYYPNTVMWWERCFKPMIDTYSAGKEQSENTTE